MPTQAIQTTTVVRAPGPFRACLGRIGQKLIACAQPRTTTTQTVVTTTPVQMPLPVAAPCAPAAKAPPVPAVAPVALPAKAAPTWTYPNFGYAPR
jgi:hypothetical protein